MRAKYVLTIILVCSIVSQIYAVPPPRGFRNAGWGLNPDLVRNRLQLQNWRQLPADDAFPAEINITRYESDEEIAGYPAVVTYYFAQNRFFQVSIKFPFTDLENFDFNYNVFRSVDEYYTEIKGKTLAFVRDIYALLRSKYGKKQPIFKGIDPRRIFQRTDLYFKKERWNLRYNPSEFYRKIVSAAYARWDFPKTRIILSINISAADKRFDYNLSYASLDITKTIQEQLDIIRGQGL